jgi:hypothetical protein
MRLARAPDVRGRQLVGPPRPADGGRKPALPPCAGGWRGAQEMPDVLNARPVQRPIFFWLEGGLRTNVLSTSRG